MRLQLKIFVLGVFVFLLTWVVAGVLMKGRDAHFFIGCLSVGYFVASYFLAKLSARGAKFLNPILSGLLVFLVFCSPVLRKGWRADLLWPLLILLISCVFAAGIEIWVSKKDNTEPKQ